MGRSIAVGFAEPFVETLPFRIQEISPGPDAGPERRIAWFSRTIYFMNCCFGFGCHFCGLFGVQKILAGMGTTHMRVLLGQLFGFLYITIEFAIGGEKMIATAIGFTVGTLSDYGIKFTAQGAVAALGEGHGRLKIKIGKCRKQKFGNPEFLIGVNACPHPCLLPQEKGNIILLLIDLIALAFIQRMVGKHP